MNPLPQSIERELANPAAQGDRHNQILRVLPCLIGEGWTPERIFALLRQRYPADFANTEIWQLINWGLSRDFAPSRSGAKAAGHKRAAYTFERRGTKLMPLTQEQRLEREKNQVEIWTQNALDWLRGFRIEEVDLWQHSPIRPPESFIDDAEMVFRLLYGRGELVNLCSDYTLREGKAQPCGGGITMSATDWIRYLQNQPIPQSLAGCWIRINPVKDKRGSGKAGSYTDMDIELFRWHLLESDCLPLELQLALLGRLRLPIGLILDSGGRSYHAWVKSYARTLSAYRAESQYLLGQLEDFGFDRGNKNPSRFARQPGVMRNIGARKTEPPSNVGVAQRIVYLNPHAQARTSIF